MKQHLNQLVELIKGRFSGQTNIFLHEPRFVGNEKKYLNDAIDSTFVSSVGPYVDRFEREFAEFLNAPKATAVVNGTAALQVALRLAGVEKNDEVITQALTFVATVNSIAYNNATPVFVDVELDTMGMSPVALGEFLGEHAELRGDHCYNKSTGKRIAACMPMHTFGFMCRIDRIVQICNQWNIPVVEDGAEALGSYFNGKPAGSFGKVAAFSFNGNKIITSGGGGVVVSQDSALTARAKYLTTTAKIPHRWEYAHDELGYNFRMPNLNAALLCAQLEQFERIKKSKKELYQEYQESFRVLGIQLKEVPADTDWNYWLMSIQLSDKRERDAFLRLSNQNGVMTRPIWQLMYRLPMYENCQRDAQRNSEFLEERIVNIPSSARL